ncbi:V-type proton ATPase subunit H-like [Periplaneta americana]|uniref:V-type proton ATPase subunit H-like n=1 Tax=Periplaneta americana TaxID=6978 RepID=UPI0037E9B42F
MNFLTSDIGKVTLPSESLVQIQGANTLNVQCYEVRNSIIKWTPYLKSQVLSPDQYTFITAINSLSDEERDTLIDQNRLVFADVTLKLLQAELHEEALQYVLVLIYDTLQANKSVAEDFCELSEGNVTAVLEPFFNLMTQGDNFTAHMAAMIIAEITTWSRKLIDTEILQSFCAWIEELLVQEQSDEYLQARIRCLQILLHREEYRLAIYDKDGINIVLTLLQNTKDFQVHYQLIFCIWMFTFSTTLAEKDIMRSTVIPLLCNFIKDSSREKVVRITLAVFRNLIEKPENPAVTQVHVLQMKQSKMSKYLKLLEQNNYEDEDILEDIDFLNKNLDSDEVNMSSFAIYAQELCCGQLKPSTARKSSSFWTRNMARLNENNYCLVRHLVHIIKTSSDPEVISLACHDIGQYVENYPQGKRVLNELGVKEPIMRHLEHGDKRVRYEALRAIQKILLTNLNAN